METQKGYLRLFRKFLDWEWYDNPYIKAIFIHCMLNANVKNKKWRNLIIKRGQFVTSYEKLAVTNGLTNQQTRTALKQLQLTNEIEYQSTNQYTIITVKNFDLYQPDNIQKNTPTTPPTNKPRGGQLTTTNNISNNSLINISSSSKEEIFEKISKEEEEILKNISKKNGIKYFRPWLRKIITNGDYIKLLEEAKKKQISKQIQQTVIKSDFKKVKDKLFACYFVGKYGDFEDINNPPEVIELMEKYGIDSYSAATEYVEKHKEKKG